MKNSPSCHCEKSCDEAISSDCRAPLGARNYLLIAAAASFSLLALPSIAFAQDDAQQLADFVAGIYNSFLLPIGCVLAGIMIMYGGISYAASAGEPSKVQRAKEYIFGAISGLVLLLSAAAIVSLILR